MKLILFGATGATGHWLAQQALEAGHEVTAAARRPEAIAVRGTALRKLRCDLFDPASVSAAVAGHDAILSAAGPRRPLGATTFFSDSARNLVAAARSAGLRRLLVLGHGAVDAGAILPAYAKPFANIVLRPLLYGMYTDSARMEGLLEASGLDWTVLRPPRLTRGAHTGRYRCSIGAHVFPLTSLSRADTADCALTLLGDPASHGHWAEASSEAWF